MKSFFALLSVCLTGCATQDWRWYRPHATQQEFNMDAGQCQAQSWSVSNPSAMQVMLVYNSCMQGKGWVQRPYPS